MKNLCRTEKKRIPKRRIQVWRMEETPAESFGHFMEEKKDDERRMDLSEVPEGKCTVDI